MAEKIEAFTIGSDTFRNDKNYKQFCDGSIWRLKQGVDFTDVARLRCALGQAASRLKMKLRTRFDKATGVLELQCVPRT